MNRSKKHAGKLILLIGLIFFFGIISVKYFKYLKQTKDCTASTIGKILAIKNPSPKGIWRITTYEYSISGTKYTVNQNLTLSVPHRPFLNEGDAINVIYSPANPKNANALEMTDFLVWFCILIITIVGLSYDIFRNRQAIKTELRAII